MLRKLKSYIDDQNVKIDEGKKATNQRLLKLRKK
jgi:hypothetical protein